MSLPATSSLCQSCGLCCNGVIFHSVQMQPQDVPHELAALGLKLKRKHGHDLIIQPCPAHGDAGCAIYDARPERCRLFECRTLRRLQKGEITDAKARAKIADAQQRAARLDVLSRRLDGSLRKGPLAKRCATALAEPFDATTHPALVAERAALARELDELEALLDKDFRVPRAEEK